MTRYIPKGVSIKLIFGPIDDRSDIWARLAPALRGHLDPWYASVSRWYLRSYDGGTIVERKTVDTVFAEAKAAWEKHAFSIFNSMPDGGELPSVAIGIDVGGRDWNNGDLYINAAWDTPDGGRFHEAQRVLRATFWALIDAIRPVASIHQGRVTVDGSAIPLPDVANLRLNTLLLVEPKAKIPRPVRRPNRARARRVPRAIRA